MVMVSVQVCGEPAFTDEARDTAQNPIVIGEVLSDAAETCDRGDPFAPHESIPSFQDDLFL